MPRLATGELSLATPLLCQGSVSRVSPSRICPLFTICHLRAFSAVSSSVCIQPILPVQCALSSLLIPVLPTLLHPQALYLNLPSSVLPFPSSYRSACSLSSLAMSALHLICVRLSLSSIRSVSNIVLCPSSARPLPSLPSAAVPLFPACD